MIVTYFVISISNEWSEWWYNSELFNSYSLWYKNIIFGYNEHSQIYTEKLYELSFDDKYKLKLKFSIYNLNN